MLLLVRAQCLPSTDVDSTFDVSRGNRMWQVAVLIGDDLLEEVAHIVGSCCLGTRPQRHTTSVELA